MGAHLRELLNQKIEELGLIYKLKLLICAIFKRLNFIKSPKYEFRVERFVASPLPHRPVRAAFLHTVPPFTVSLKVGCDRFLVSLMASILPLAF